MLGRFINNVAVTYLNNSLSDTWSAANYSYDELGRLITSENGKTAAQGSSALSPSTTAPVLSNTLAYNIQGWMTVQTDSLKKGAAQSTHKSLYSQTLRYHNPIKTATQKSYDDLITEWETVQYSNGTDFSAAGSTQDKNTYAFTYDNQGRLASSSRYAGGNTSPNSSFTEKNLSYDKNGNILALTRYGAGDATIKDDFTYSYSGNRIKKLGGTHDGSAITHTVQNNTVAGTADYLYDDNGNMTYDALRHIAMTYDLNNLVTSVSRNDTLLSNYTYLANGTKYKVVDTAGNGRYYIGPFCLSIEKTGSGSSAQTMAYLESIDSETGRILAIRQQTGSGTNATETTSYATVFFVKDHLGSVRAVVDSQGHILERNAYYPFGLQMTMGKAYPSISSSLSTLYPNILASTPTRRDLYNGKELQTVAGTDYIDYGFRQYDPVTARWMAVDPKAEKYIMTTPYIYCAGNPILLVDLYGNASTEYDTTGKIISDLGGKDYDFYHQTDGDVKVVNNANGKSNIIKGGSFILSNYERRKSTTTWKDITNEFICEVGPVYSLFVDLTNKNEGVFSSLTKYNSTYTSLARSDILKGNSNNKNMVPVYTSNANPLSAGTDMWEQMIGEANISWYDLGDRFLYLLIDSKSNSSLFLHIPNNRERGEPGFGYGNTYQAYMWVETKKEVEEKNNTYLKMIELFMKSIMER